MLNEFSADVSLSRSEDGGSDEPAGPKRADARANRALILDTAEALFAERGVEAVTMADVAAAAGVGKGTLYRAVANKGELCLAVMDADLRAFQDETLAILRASRDRSALARLLDFLDRLTGFMDQHGALMCEAEAHGIHWHARPEINQTSLHDWFHATIRQLLLRARVEGSVAAAGDVDYWTDAILAPLNPRLFMHQRKHQGYSVEQISQNLRAFVRQGIGGKSPAN